MKKATMTPLKPIAEIIASVYAGKYRKSLCRLNPPMKVRFGYIPEGWLPEICWGDLTWVWRKHGIRATGIAGFICGDKDSHSCSTLWNPASPSYLAWCGVYIYKPDDFSDFYDPVSGATETARNIGYKDDITWSRMYGNKKANYEEIHMERLKAPLLVHSYPVESYFSTVRCQTYLGAASTSNLSRLASCTLASLYRRTSGVILDDRFFLPDPRFCVEHAYEDVLRDVWVARVICADHGVIYAVYATSVRAEDNSWNYTEELSSQFKRFFNGVRLEA